MSINKQIHHIFLSDDFSRLIRINYYHAFVQGLLPVINYTRVNNIQLKDVILYTNCSYTHVLKWFLNVRPLSEKPHDAVIILENGTLDMLAEKCSAFMERVKMSALQKDSSLSISKPYMVFIKRSGKRKILNSNACITTLFKNFGTTYTIIPIDFSRLGFLQQVRLMNQCAVLIGAHGAGMTNCLFMNPDTCIIELFPESFFYDCYRKLCRYKKIHHYSMNGISEKKPCMNLEEFKKVGIKDFMIRGQMRDVSFTINIDEFLNTVSNALPKIEF
jgi:capsular polysaccharide biosynthesis protein